MTSTMLSEAANLEVSIQKPRKFFCVSKCTPVSECFEFPQCSGRVSEFMWFAFNIERTVLPRVLLLEFDR